MDAPENASAADPSKPVSMKLRTPVEWGKDQTIDELTLKPTARAFKEMTLAVDPNTGKVDYQPYALALVGIRMAGHPPAVLDRMDHRDMLELSQLVFGFLG